MLKVSSPQPQVQEPPMQPAPMPGPSMTGDDPMGQVPPMDDNEGMPPELGDEPNPYEADFDAGVDADENSDPKRFIQQLTGKLSQSLRSYNEQLPQPDADLNKYVAGMIIKQCIIGLSQEDVKDILDKVESDEESEMPLENDGEQSAQQDGQQQDMPTESLERRGLNSQISELYDELVGGENATSSTVADKNMSGGYRSKPIRSPRFN